MNDHDYAAWVYDMAHPGWRATPGEFEMHIGWSEDQWAVWNSA